MTVPLRPCPGNCGRATYPRVRRTDYLNAEDKALVERMGAVKAVTKDGTCTKCWNTAHGYGTRRGSQSRHRNPNARTRQPMTDAEVEQARQRIKDFWRDRRARGIDPEGMPVEEWARGNGGLYASEVR